MVRFHDSILSLGQQLRQIAVRHPEIQGVPCRTDMTRLTDRFVPAHHPYVTHLHTLSLVVVGHAPDKVGGIPCPGLGHRVFTLPRLDLHPRCSGLLRQCHLLLRVGPYARAEQQNAEACDHNSNTQTCSLPHRALFLPLSGVWRLRGYRRMPRNRRTRSLTGGCVENSVAIAPADSGFTMNRCAVAGLACGSGEAFVASCSFSNAVASP